MPARVIAIVLSALFSLACAEAPEPGGSARLPGRAANGESANAGAEVAQQPSEPAAAHPAAQAGGRAQPAAQAAPGGQAPAQFTVRLNTTKGNVDIEVTRAWAPHGADRFYELVQTGYFSDIAFFRVISGFMAQGGIHGDPAVAAQWRSRNIADDPVVEHNRPGMVSYAMAGPGTRTTQFFVNLADNSNLDSMGFAPFGRVRDMSVMNQIYSGYGEGAPSGRGPAQGRVQREGNTYLRAEFPELDYIRSATILDAP